MRIAILGTLLLVVPYLPSQAGKGTAGSVAQPLEVVHLGSGRKIVGNPIKQTGTILYLDVGFDILKVPLSAVVRRAPAGAASAKRKNNLGDDIFATAERPQKTIAEGAAEVGEAVVKIETGSGQGSGFILSKDGFIVTNFHVVKGEKEVKVTLYLKSRNGFDLKTVRKVKVVATSPHIDLALLKMTPPKGVQLQHVFIGDSRRAKVGEQVFAVGTPIGLERTVSSGIISVTNRTWSGFTHFQMTTPINPGNSGGPLFNLRGEVVGVNSAGHTGMQGLNYAIPAKYVIDFLRNRDAFAVDASRDKNGIHYMPGPRKPKPAQPKPAQPKQKQ